MRVSVFESCGFGVLTPAADCAVAMLQLTAKRVSSANPRRRSQGGKLRARARVFMLLAEYFLRNKTLQINQCSDGFGAKLLRNRVEKSRCHLQAMNVP
jgi:hypothetical protein